GGLYQQGFGLDNITSLLQCYGVLIGIIVISVVAASATILVKKPKDILSKVS
ncbi:MAG: ABC transporter permease, partial [[Eubacterium] sulci]|nr:ABC transporter permease [[Eubacterium] sulci]